MVNHWSVKWWDLCWSSLWHHIRDTGNHPSELNSHFTSRPLGIAMLHMQKGIFPTDATICRQMCVYLSLFSWCFTLSAYHHLVQSSAYFQDIIYLHVEQKQIHDVLALDYGALLHVDVVPVVRGILYVNVKTSAHMIKISLWLHQYLSMSLWHVRLYVCKDSQTFRSYTS